MIDEEAQDILRRIKRFRKDWINLYDLFVSFRNNSTPKEKDSIRYEVLKLSEILNHDYASLAGIMHEINGTSTVMIPLGGVHFNPFTKMFLHIKDLNNPIMIIAIKNDHDGGLILLDKAIAALEEYIEELRKETSLEYYLKKIILKPIKTYLPKVWNEFKSLQITHIILLILIFLFIFGLLKWKDIYHLLELAVKK